MPIAARAPRTMPHGNQRNYVATVRTESIPATKAYSPVVLSRQPGRRSRCSCAKMAETSCRSARRPPSSQYQFCSGKSSRPRRQMLTLWFVFRLSTCFRKTSVHRSLQRNLMTSSVSLNRGRSREKLSRRDHQHFRASRTPRAPT